MDEISRAQAEIDEGEVPPGQIDEGEVVMSPPDDRFPTRLFSKSDAYDVFKDNLGAGTFGCVILGRKRSTGVRKKVLDG